MFAPATPNPPFAGDAEGLADTAAVATLLQSGFDPYGAADFFSHLLYASLQGLTVDSALMTEFGLPNGISARSPSLVFSAASEYCKGWSSVSAASWS